MKPLSPKMPPNRGRILLAHNNKAELRFWIRVFELEGQLAEAQARFNAQNDQYKWGAVPIINHYVSGDLTWFYVLVIDVDMLGVVGGTGIIWYADAENCEMACQARDKFADDIMGVLQGRAKKGQLTELMIIGPGQQQ